MGVFLQIHIKLRCAESSKQAGGCLLIQETLVNLSRQYDKPKDRKDQTVLVRLIKDTLLYVHLCLLLPNIVPTVFPTNILTLLGFYFVRPE